MGLDEVKQLLKDEGWESSVVWNNREMYFKKSAPIYQVFEHQCEIGIVNPCIKELELVYCDMTADELREYGRLCERLYACVTAPESVTVAQLRDAEQEMCEFVRRIKRKGKE